MPSCKYSSRRNTPPFHCPPFPRSQKRKPRECFRRIAAAPNPPAASRRPELECLLLDTTGFVSRISPIIKFRSLRWSTESRPMYNF
jgi:hypothetical protein